MDNKTQPEKTYSVKEAADIVGIKERAIQTRCKKDNIRKKSNRYLITDSIISRWKAERNAIANAIETHQTQTKGQIRTQAVNRITELEKELIAIKLFAKTLDESYQELKKKKQIPASSQELQNAIDEKELALMGVADRQNKIAALHTKQSSLQLQIKKLEIENKLLTAQVKKDEGLHMEVKTQRQKIKNLEDRLEPFQIAPNERLEVFTNSQYIEFETKLKEWHTLQRDIEYNEKLFAVEKKGLKERSKHYKQQYEYQQKQSTKILDMHQKLLDTIDKQSNLAIQRNVIEAISKDVIDKDWKPKK